MTTQTSVKNASGHHDHDHGASNAVFGFWMFILSDFVLFATLFASYAVLKDHTVGDVGIRQVAGLPYVLVQSLVLLVCSLTFGFCSLAAQRGRSCGVRFWLLITFIFGAIFFAMDYHVLANLYVHGHTWHNSAFLSIYYTLIGFHGLHLLVGLVWMIVLMLQLSSQGLTAIMKTRIACLGLFVHFLNILWIFIFTTVYLMGAL